MTSVFPALCFRSVPWHHGRFLAGGEQPDRDSLHSYRLFCLAMKAPLLSLHGSNLTKLVAPLNLFLSPQIECR